MLSCWYKFKEYVIKEYFKLLWKWLVINFEVAHDTCPQIDIGLLQAFGKDDMVLDKVVEALELSENLDLISHFSYAILPHPKTITFL